jgi:hypothetical protein
MLHPASKLNFVLFKGKKLNTITKTQNFKSMKLLMSFFVFSPFRAFVTTFSSFTVYSSNRKV